MKICGVVVLYNPKKSINDRIKSYIDYIDKLYIIDNSINNNIDILINDNKIVYIPNNQNLGIAKALNIGAEKAYKDGSDWILTMDQDSTFKKNSIKELIQYVKKCNYKKVGLVSPWHITKFNNKKPDIQEEKVIEVMTSGNIVNLKAWKSINGWKDYFFIDNVDTEFCMNLNVSGYDVIRLNNVELDHNLGHIKERKLFGKKVFCTNHNYIRHYYMIRNLYYLRDLYIKEYPDFIKYMKRNALSRMKNIIIFEKDKYRKIRNMFRGYFDYKKGIKGEYRFKN